MSLGAVIVGDDVEIGPNVIEQSEREPIIVADGVKIGGLGSIGHDCTIGPGTELVAMVGLARSGDTNTASTASEAS